MKTMTTNRRPTSGRGQQDDPSKLDSYQKASKTATVGNHMRTFARTKTSKIITAWNDPDYFHQICLYFYPLADLTGSVDPSTVLSAQLENILDLTWELFYTNANLKDLVAAEEAAWKLYFGVMFCICMEVQLQYNTRCYLPAYTESDTVSGTTTELSYFAQSSFDIFLASMKDYPVPGAIYAIVDAFATWVIQLTQPYSRFTIDIPACFINPFQAIYDLEDLEAMRNILRVNLGNTVTHAKKFGLKMGKWRDPIKPTVKTLSDPDVIAYFNHAAMQYGDGAAVNIVYEDGGFRGTDLTTNYTETEYFFKDNPNESILHVLAPWFGLYNATNNPYGGLIIHADIATEYYINASLVALHGVGTDPVRFGYGSTRLMDSLALLFKCFTDQTGAALSLSWNGTDFSTEQLLDDGWLLEIFNHLYYGTNRGATETNNDLINFIGRLL